jgi:hypothetical protein
MKFGYRYGIGILAAFHALVGYAILHPQVADDYRAYFITGSDFMSPWQHKAMVPLESGKTYAADDPALVYVGWYLREDKQRWNAGREARFLFRVADADRRGAAHAVTLYLSPLGVQRSVWRLNGHEIDAHLLDGAAALRLPLDGAVLREGQNEITVACPMHVRSATATPRCGRCASTACATTEAACNSAGTLLRCFRVRAA